MSLSMCTNGDERVTLKVPIRADSGIASLMAGMRDIAFPPSE
jgi:hypothetical protein